MEKNGLETNYEPAQNASVPSEPGRRTDAFEEADRSDAERLKAKRRKSLDRYLEGWIVREVLDINGNVRRERIYVGDYYTSEESKLSRILRKVLYFLCYAASIALFAVCAVQVTGANTASYTALAQGIVLLAIIWVLSSFFTYLTAPAKMTVADYKGGSLAVKKSCFCMALSLVLPALATLVHLCIDPVQWGKELLCCLGYLCGGGLMLLVFFAEKKLNYKKSPSPDKAWADAHDELDPLI